jgi:2'-5' RNA ligase
LFVAVFPPPDAVRSLRRALPASASLTRAEKWHVTVVFLGEVDGPRVDAVAEILSGVAPPRPFGLRLAGGGRFGEVAWAGLDGDLDHLGALHDELRTALTAGGFSSDDRPYNPHMTVSYHGDAATRRALAAFSGKPWEVSEFALVRSLAGEYEQLRAWPMARSGPGR